MLTFFGDGGAFAFDRGNTNAFFKNGDELLLFDCGSKILFDIISQNLLDGVKKIQIFITHLHPDHAGGLAALCDYLFYDNIVNNKNVEYNIYYPNSQNIETILKLMLVEIKHTQLKNPESSEYVKGVFNQKHFENAYGYLFEINGKKIYYSGDTSEINKDSIKLLINNQIDYYYHEASLTKNPWHTYLYEIADAVPENLRHKVYIMHINSQMENEVKKLGFNLCNKIMK